MALDTSIYRNVRPLPSFLSQLGDIQNLETGAQHQQLNALEIQARQQDMQQRAQALKAQQTIDQLMKDSADQNGNVDETKLKQGFVGSGMGHLWPQVEEQLVKVKEAHVKLNEALDKADTDENEKLAATFAFLDASGNDPKTAAETLQALTSHGVSAQRVAPILQQLQQAPTADTVKAIGQPYVKTSPTQTRLTDERTRTAETVKREERLKAEEEDKAAARRLANASRMMYTSGMRDPTGKERAAVRAGLDPELQKYFDDDFDPKLTPQLDLNAGETPNQIALREQARVDAAERQRKNLAAEAMRRKADENTAKAQASAAQHRKWIEGHGRTADPDERRNERAYNNYRTDQQREYSAKMQAWRALQNTAGAFDKDGNPVPPPDYEAPESYDNWLASKGEKKKPAAAAASAPAKATGDVKIKTPDGRIRYVSADKLAEAKAHGATVVP